MCSGGAHCIARKSGKNRRARHFPADSERWTHHLAVFVSIQLHAIASVAHIADLRVFHAQLIFERVDQRDFVPQLTIFLLQLALPIADNIAQRMSVA